MAWFWFGCFLISVLFIIVAQNNLKAMSEKMKSADDKVKNADAQLSAANTKIEEARELESKAKLLNLNAIASIESISDKNRVFNKAVEEITNLWINDTWKSITDKLTSENYLQQKGRLTKAFEVCKKLGIEFDKQEENVFLNELDAAWKVEVKNQKAKDEQNRVKEIMREEQQAERVRQAELKKIAQMQKKLEEEVAEQTEKIKVLREMEALQKLTEVQQAELDLALTSNEKLKQEIQDSERKKSMAELTKAGHVYVISNIGTFGKDVFKVGMTRRLIPEDRVKELGDASVPFPFDVHLMISTEDAPALENKLHEALWNKRVNLVNNRKEFFNTELKNIVDLVSKFGKGVTFEVTEISEASQWRESQARRASGEYGSFEIGSSIESDEEEAA